MSEKASIKTGIIGADTTFLVDFLQGDSAAAAFMRTHAKLIRINELVVYEFLCGNLTKEQQRIFFEAIQSFSAVPFNREAAILSSELYRQLKAKGRTAGNQDCMIAGCYLAHGIQSIVTRNAKHFKDIIAIETVEY